MSFIRRLVICLYLITCNCLHMLTLVTCYLEVKNMSFDHNKTAPKKRKKQLPAKEMGEERRSTLSIRFATSHLICKVFFYPFVSAF